MISEIYINHPYIVRPFPGECVFTGNQLLWRRCQVRKKFPRIFFKKKRESYCCSDNLKSNLISKIHINGSYIVKPPTRLEESGNICSKPQSGKAVVGVAAKNVAPPDCFRELLFKIFIMIPTYPKTSSSTMNSLLQAISAIIRCPLKYSECHTDFPETNPHWQVPTNTGQNHTADLK